MTKKTLKNKDITGMQFGRLQAVRRAGSMYKARVPAWRCKCECGETVEVSIYSLLNGKTRSCGCWRQERGNALSRMALTPILPDEEYTDMHVSGVVWKAGLKKWDASIRYKDKRIPLGRFDSHIEAVKARIAAEQVLFAPSANKHFEKRKKLEITQNP